MEETEIEMYDMSYDKKPYKPKSFDSKLEN